MALAFRVKSCKPSNSCLFTLQRGAKEFLHVFPECATLLECVKTLKPSALIGVAAMHGAFTKEVLHYQINPEARNPYSGLTTESLGHVSEA